MPIQELPLRKTMSTIQVSSGKLQMALQAEKSSHATYRLADSSRWMKIGKLGSPSHKVINDRMGGRMESNIFTTEKDVNRLLGWKWCLCIARDNRHATHPRRIPRRPSRDNY